MDFAAACAALGLPAAPPPAADAVSAAFRKLALKHHPDRNLGNEAAATAAFQALSSARDAALAGPPARGGGGGGGARKSTAGKPTAASLGLRRMAGAELSAEQCTEAGLSAVWACGGCEAASDSGEFVCCRLNPTKQVCQCGHKLKAHAEDGGFRCAERGCRCRCYSYCDLKVRCGCKHRAAEHSKLPPFGCEAKGGCDCAGHAPTRVCDCGHGAAEHRTTFVQSPWRFGMREWVCGALRPEAAALAKERRAQWVRDGRAPAGASEAANRLVAEEIYRSNFGAAAGPAVEGDGR